VHSAGGSDRPRAERDRRRLEARKCATTDNGHPRALHREPRQPERHLRREPGKRVRAAGAAPPCKMLARRLGAGQTLSDRVGSLVRSAEPQPGVREQHEEIGLLKDRAHGRASVEEFSHLLDGPVIPLLVDGAPCSQDARAADAWARAGRAALGRSAMRGEASNSLSRAVGLLQGMSPSAHRRVDAGADESRLALACYRRASRWADAVREGLDPDIARFIRDQAAAWQLIANELSSGCGIEPARFARHLAQDRVDN
jgi:hypothetical protein